MLFADHSTDDEKQAALQWLFPAGLEQVLTQEYNLKLRQPGTWSWFLNEDKYQEWKISARSKLWLHGIPGAGKTILVSTMIDDLAKDLSNDHGLAFFFCDFKTAETQDVPNILRSLIKQFVLQDEGGSAMIALLDFRERHSRGPTIIQSAQYLELLHKVVQPFTSSSIVIDGLDEIRHNRPAVLEDLTTIQNSASSINLLFSSRREVDIEEQLRDFQKLSVSASESDLKLYVAAELGTRIRRKQLKIGDPDLKGDIIARLATGAGGMFRWAACQVDYLCGLKTDLARRNALDKLPHGLTATYESTLSRILDMQQETQELVRQTLQWVSFANMPLHASTLVQALAIRPGEYHFEPTAVPAEEDVLETCSSLINRQADGALVFAHFTVPEYLSSIDIDGTPQFAKFRLSETEANYLIGSVCLTYLNLDVFSATPLDESALNKLADYEEDETDMRLVTTPVLSSRASILADDDPLGQVPVSAGLLIADGKPVQALKTQRQKSTFGTLEDALGRWLDTKPLMVYSARYWHHHCGDHLGNSLIADMSHRLFHPEKPEQFFWWSQSFLHLVIHAKTTTLYPDAQTLHWASCLALYEVCDWLLQNGVDVNRCSSLGRPFECLLLSTTALADYDVRPPFSNFPPPDRKAMTARAKIAQLFLENGLSLKELGSRPIKTLDDRNIPHTPLAIALVADPHNEELISNLLARYDSETSIDIFNIFKDNVIGRAHCDIAHIPRGYVAFVNAINPETLDSAAQRQYQALVQRIDSCQICSSQYHEPDEDTSVLSLLGIERLRRWFSVSAHRGQLPALKASLSN
ncbi:hypothetical protein PV11_03240 [Exophiala sideris]|uniref:NACHT domain-containing protein n=1 Tax=Exophiala sideris TaxID=1016849 RepID=A0A0D1XHQ2_9EURO|nr:hypothetical protein PV11_03240 [Exophiala sideris]